MVNYVILKFESCYSMTTCYGMTRIRRWIWITKRTYCHRWWWLVTGMISPASLAIRSMGNWLNLAKLVQTWLCLFFFLRFGPVLSKYMCLSVFLCIFCSCSFLPISVHFYWFLFVSDFFFHLLSFSVHFCLFMCVTVRFWCICLFLSGSVRLGPFMYVNVHLCNFWSLSVWFCLFCLFLFVSVRFVGFSVSFRQSLSVSSPFFLFL